MSIVIPEISLISLQNQSKSDLKILKEALNTHGFFTIIAENLNSYESSLRTKMYAPLGILISDNIFFDSTYATEPF